MKKRIVLALLALASLLMFPSSAYASLMNETQSVEDVQSLSYDSQSVSAEEASSSVPAGWIQVGNRWWYRHADGSYTKSGWENIDGKKYYFDKDGWMKTSWLYLNGNYYYLHSSGYMMTGWQLVNNKYYYMGSDGIMAADTWIGDCYVDSSGAWIPGKLRPGWVKVGDKWWYRHADGSYTTSGWETIDGKQYYFDKDGWMKTGWLYLNGKYYYLHSSGYMMTGWQLVNNKYYYMYSDGIMAADTWIGDCYVDSSGAWIPGKMRTGWIQAGDRWWYRHADGSYTKSGWENIGGKKYYFDKDGWMKTGWLYLNGNYYYLHSNGYMTTGWQLVYSQYYYMYSNGIMAADTWIGDCYVDSSGAWIPGKLRPGWVQAGDRWWYRHEDGSYTTSGWETIDGKQYYFDADGWMKTGWLKLGNNWYYLKPSGEKAYNYWVGTTGVGGYYINQSGVMVANTTLTIGSYVYTFDNNGKCTSRMDRYISRTDPANRKTYRLERQFETDPQVGVDITEDELLAAAVYTEAGNQGMPGMTGVAMVMLNRMANSAFPASANFVIYQAGQFEVARNGSLTKWLNNIDSSTLNNAKKAVSNARAIMNAYKTSGTPRVIDGLTMPEGKEDFNCLYFMTPATFKSLNLDEEACAAFTYKNTTFFTYYHYKQ